MTMKHRGSNSRVFPDLSQPYENQYTSRHCVNNKSLRLACHSFLYRFRPAGGAIRLIAINYGKKEYLLLGLDAKRSNKPLNFIVIIPAYLISFKVSLLLVF